MHFNIRVIKQGDHYGLNDCLTHDNEQAMVEFYDPRYTTDGFTPLGQFVSRYYVDTLVVHDVNTGLLLDGGVPEWSMSATELQSAIAVVRQIVEGSK